MYSKQGFILYFDILGYKNIVGDSSDGSNERLKYILDLYSETQGKLNFAFVFDKEYIANKDKLFMKCFSDNFLFLYKNRPFSECNTNTLKKNYYNTLSKMMSVAQMVQSQFLVQGILTRGSLSFGEVFYNDNIVYGKSIINAVMLEEEHPEPSIVIDPYYESIGANELFTYTPSVNPFMYQRDSEADHYAVLGGIKKCLQTSSLERKTQERREQILYKINWMIERMNEYFQYDGVKQYYLDEKQSLREKKSK